MFTNSLYNLIFINFSESLSLLIFGISLTVLTVVLRALLSRFDNDNGNGTDLKK